MNKLHNIKDRREFAIALSIPLKDLTYVLYEEHVGKFYKTFEIPKKSGGTRVIHASTGILKHMQQSLCEILNSSVKSNNISHGFQKGKSIYTNASVHRNKRFVLNVDLSDFFDSFHFGRVRGFFKNNKDFLCSEEITLLIAQIACYQGKLPQGAPSSPVITNLICGSLDFRISKLCKKYKLDYTRYADDMTFSTNNIYFLRDNENFIKELTSVVVRSGFKINEKKTRLLFKDSRQEVTGVIVNKKLNAPREYYKKTRAMAYNFYKNHECMIDNKQASLNQIEGRFGYINNFDKLNNSKRIQNGENINKNEMNARENEYKKLLFYKYFYYNDFPLLITEGKTDILYLKAALKALDGQYKNLYDGSLDKNNRFKIRFLKRTNRMCYFFGLNKDGADTLKQFYTNHYKSNKNNKRIYFDYFKTFNYYPRYPVIILLDNEPDGKHPLGKFLSGNGDNKKKILDELNNIGFIRLNSLQNIYLTIVPNVTEKENCEIEALFPPEILNMKLQGKTFNPTGKKDNCFTKDDLAKYVIKNYKKINFKNFTLLLDRIENIIEDYQKWINTNPILDMKEKGKSII